MPAFPSPAERQRLLNRRWFLRDCGVGLGAIALNAMNFNIARSLGPAIGGAIVAAAGAAAAFAVNAFSYIGLITVLARWRPQREPRTLPREGLFDAMAAGIRYVAMSPTLRAVLLRAAVFGLAASAIPALMLDAGWPIEAMKGIPLLARAAGLVAHLYEESQRSIGFIMSHKADQAISYDGPLAGHGDDRKSA